MIDELPPEIKIIASLIEDPLLIDDEVNAVEYSIGLEEFEMGESDS